MQNLSGGTRFKCYPGPFSSVSYNIVLIDTGNSYQGLCELIHRKTKGEDGIYYTYTEEKPISFNPFFTDGAPIMEA